jgi:hypothetical protein
LRSALGALFVGISLLSACEAECPLYRCRFEFDLRLVHAERAMVRSVTVAMSEGLRRFDCSNTAILSCGPGLLIVDPLHLGVPFESTTLDLDLCLEDGRSFNGTVPLRHHSSRDSDGCIGCPTVTGDVPFDAP